MSRQQPPRARIQAILVQSRNLLQKLINERDATTDVYERLCEDVYDLNQAITDYNNTPELTLLGDSVTNEDIFHQLTVGLSDTLVELCEQLSQVYQQGDGSSSSSSRHDIDRIQERHLHQLLHYFTVSVRTLTTLIKT